MQLPSSSPPVSLSATLYYQRKRSSRRKRNSAAHEERPKNPSHGSQQEPQLILQEADKQSVLEKRCLQIYKAELESIKVALSVINEEKEENNRQFNSEEISFAALERRDAAMKERVDTIEGRIAKLEGFRLELGI